MFSVNQFFVALSFVLAFHSIRGSLEPHAAQTSKTTSDIELKVRALEASCVGNLRTLNVAQSSYWGGDPRKGFARTLDRLGPKGEDLIVATLATGKKDGYRFKLVPGPTEATGVILHYTISARPVPVLVERQRSFFTDETGVIRFTREKRAAKASDAPIQ